VFGLRAIVVSLWIFGGEEVTDLGAFAAPGSIKVWWVAAPAERQLQRGGMQGVWKFKRAAFASDSQHLQTVQ